MTANREGGKIPRMRRRLGLFLNQWDFGGIASFCTSLAQGLSERGWEVHLILGERCKRRDRAAETSFQEMEAHRSFQMEILHWRDFHRKDRALYAWKKLHERNFPLLMINGWGGILPAFHTLASQTRLVTIGHGNHTGAYNEFIEAHYFVHRHVAISSSIQQQCCKLCTPPFASNVVLIPHGSAIQPVEAIAQQREQRRESLQVCYCGRFDFTDKRMQDLPLTWRTFRKKGGQGTLSLIGTGEKSQWLEQAFAQEIATGEVVMKGQLTQKELAGVLSQQDVFLNLSNWEGLSIAAIEAALCGCFLVLSDTFGHIDVVGALPSGALCHLGDPEAFSQALLTVAEQKKQKKAAPLRQALQKKAHEIFSLKRMLDQYEALFSQVLQEPLRAPASHLPQIDSHATLAPPLSGRWWSTLWRQTARRLRSDISYP